MNLVNLFGNKLRGGEPEYYLAIEIHESLIKTALWEVVEGQPSFVDVGSYESWADEESLINGVVASLEQAVKTISSEPRKVIFGLPDSWITDGKIHPTKTKLISNLIKELGLDPIGMVPINSAIAHYMKKMEGIPPTAILLEIYTTKVVVSVIEKGEITASEEAARSGDLAQDVEEGLTVIGKEKLPARFILTNGGALEEEEQRITSHPWQERLPFQNLPKVETLPVDFSIRAIALTGGSEAVHHLSGEVEESLPPQTAPVTEEANIYVPKTTPASINDLGFSYEEAAVPEALEKEIEIETDNSSETSAIPKYAIAQETEPSAPALISQPVTPRRSFSLPSLPKIHLPKLPQKKFSFLYLLFAPVILILGFVAYLFAGQAEISINFSPQKISNQFTIAISDSPVSSLPTLVASKKTVTGSTKEQAETTGEVTVGDKATGTITIANKSVSPLTLKSGTTIVSENGKYVYLLSEQTVIASKSADPLTFQETYGKATGVKVTAVKIGADYNLSQNTTFSVDNYSRNVAYAVAESNFSGGTSRAVRAVSKSDQDKLLQTAGEKIKSQIESSTQDLAPGQKSLVLSDLTYTKKTFDKNVGEEATSLNLELEGSVETLVYSEDSLFQLVSGLIAPQVPSGSEIFPESTLIKLEEPAVSEGHYQAKVSVETSLFPQLDEEKYRKIVRGKPVSSIRPIFATIQGFSNLSIKISPPVPIFTKFLPYSHVSFKMVEK